MFEKVGEIDLRIEGRLYLVRNVSYEECPFCGEKVLTPDVARDPINSSNSITQATQQTQITAAPQHRSTAALNTSHWPLNTNRSVGKPYNFNFSKTLK